MVNCMKRSQGQARTRADGPLTLSTANSASGRHILEVQRCCTSNRIVPIPDSQATQGEAAGAAADAAAAVTDLQQQLEDQRARASEVEPRLARELAACRQQAEAAAREASSEAAAREAAEPGARTHQQQMQQLQAAQQQSTPDTAGGGTDQLPGAAASATAAALRAEVLQLQTYPAAGQTDNRGAAAAEGTSAAAGAQQGSLAGGAKAAIRAAAAEATAAALRSEVEVLKEALHSAAAQACPPQRMSGIFNGRAYAHAWCSSAGKSKVQLWHSLSRAFDHCYFRHLQIHRSRLQCHTHC